MAMRASNQRLRVQVIMSVLIVVLFCTSMYGQSKDEDVFGAVPAQLRARLVERLKLLVEYQRTQQWDKQYHLLSELFTQGDTEEVHVQRLKHLYAESLGEVLIDFVPRSVAVHSASVDYGEWTLFGCAKLREKGRVVELYASASAYREKGDWYFSSIGVITPIDGRPEPCPYEKEKEGRSTKRCGESKTIKRNGRRVLNLR